MAGLLLAGGAAMALHPETLHLKDRVPPERWRRIEERARERVAILDEVAARYAATRSWRKALVEVAPEVGWSQYQHWRRHAERRPGQPWERQLDERVPPQPYRVSPEVRSAACTLRRAMPTVGCAEARRLLVDQLGADRGKVSAASLKRIWKAVGLALPRGRCLVEKAERVEPVAEQKENVRHFHGGGGLALIAAAAAETKVASELATVVLAHAAQVVSSQPESSAPEEPAGRDERGRLTAAYNRAVRGSLPRDPRWDTDAKKRARRNLLTLKLPQGKPETVGHKLLAMGFTPLLTERRGFDGLEGPAGAWQEVLGGAAYQPATLDKTLAELALVDAGGVLWTRHGQLWVEVTRAWREGPDEPRWLRWITYVDATQEPYWTQAFAVSGKVSRVGRVMPCLTRVALMGGAGVPLLVETKAGTVSLKKELLPTLARFEEAIGKGELGRLTVVDAEMATAGLLTALKAREQKWFITVLKGNTEQGAKKSEIGAWQRYRERDLVRELTVRLHGKEAPEEGLVLRGVEMVREGSRNPTSTLFVTDASAEELATAEVPTAYLSRWPHQEQRFREGRNGPGLERTHGYGGEYVTHVALATAQEKAQRAEERAQERTTTATTALATAQALAATVPPEQKAAAQDNVRRAEREQRAAEAHLVNARAERERLATMPREIYVRDTTRDGLMTCLKVTALMLIEYVLKEYFGGGRMEVRTFIEDFVRLAVTVRETTSQLVYQIESNPRSSEKMQWLRIACEEATRRNIHVGGRRLTLEVLPAPSG